MKHRRVTVILAGLTLLVLALSLPGSLRNAYDRGGLYLFSRAFLEDIPKRLAGPGRFRFILQPVTAIVLGFAMAWLTRGRDGRRICTGCSYSAACGASCCEAASRAW